MKATVTITQPLLEVEQGSGNGEALSAVVEFANIFKGETGPQGPQGPKGKSAYQTWLDAGNNGTEAQFLASLRGADGQNGTDVIEISYDELLLLYGKGKLIPGMRYRIINYETVTDQPDIVTANHRFDLIVLASSVNTLFPVAAAAIPLDDHYWEERHADLSKWLVWYDIVNNSEKYKWIGKSNGTGVIYRLIDEWGNDCPYDFKNIMFTLPVENGNFCKSGGDCDHFYTFDAFEDGIHHDASVVYNALQPTVCSRNRIEPLCNKKDGYMELNRIVFMNSKIALCKDNIVEVNCYDILFGNGCMCNHVGQESQVIRIAADSHYNLLGARCREIGLGYDRNKGCISDEKYCFNEFAQGTSRVYLIDPNYNEGEVRNHYFAQGYNDGLLHIVEVDHNFNPGRITHAILPSGSKVEYCEDESNDQVLQIKDISVRGDSEPSSLIASFERNGRPQELHYVVEDGIEIFDIFGIVLYDHLTHHIIVDNSKNTKNVKVYIKSPRDNLSFYSVKGHHAELINIEGLRLGYDPDAYFVVEKYSTMCLEILSPENSYMGGGLCIRIKGSTTGGTLI